MFKIIKKIFKILDEKKKTIQNINCLMFISMFLETIGIGTMN